MGGKTWSREEERCFWNVIVPQSPNAIKYGDRTLSWENCTEIMQQVMGDKARRRYTKLLLSEHFFQNVQTGHRSPCAHEFVSKYKRQLEAEQDSILRRTESRTRATNIRRSINRSGVAAYTSQSVQTTEPDSSAGPADSSMSATPSSTEGASDLPMRGTCMNDTSLGSLSIVVSSTGATGPSAADAPDTRTTADGSDSIEDSIPKARRRSKRVSNRPMLDMWLRGVRAASSG